MLGPAPVMFHLILLLTNHLLIEHLSSFSNDQDAYHCLLHWSDGLHWRYVLLFDRLEDYHLWT